MEKSIRFWLVAGTFALTCWVILPTSHSHAQVGEPIAVPTPTQDEVDRQILNSQIGTPQAPPAVTSAEILRRPNQNEFTALAGVPGITNLGRVTMGEFVNALYRMLIVIGALWAVLKITLAGLKYMGSDNFGNKSEAKEDIKSSLLGLLILLATALIITTVMGGVDLNAFRNTPIVPYTPQSPPPLNPTPGGGAGGGGAVSVKKEAGCNQLGANNVTCSSGKVGTISGNKIECHPQGNIPYVSGQDTFKPVTETACVYTGGHTTIQGGGLIYGNQTLSVAELRSKYGTSMGAQEVLDAHKASILETCKTMSGNVNAKIIIKSPGMIGGGFWSSSELAYFTCSS